MTDKAISPTGSPLRQRMIEDMEVRGFIACTQQGYIRADDDLRLRLRAGPDSSVLRRLVSLRSVARAAELPAR